MLTFLDVPVTGAYHLVSAIAAAVAPFLGEFATAAAIVAFTIGVRLLLHPLARAAARGDKARAELAPQLQKLRQKHGNDQQRLAAELSRLQAESGTSLFTGCLPLLLQLPFFMVMYRLFASPRIGGTDNGLLGHELFGAPLGGHFLGAGMPHTLVYIGLFLLLAVVAFLATRIQAKVATTMPPTGASMRLLRLMPYATVLVAAVVPLAAGLYLLTTTTWTVLERAALRRPGSPGGPDPGKVITGPSGKRRA